MYMLYLILIDIMGIFLILFIEVENFINKVFWCKDIN